MRQALIPMTLILCGALTACSNPLSGERPASTARMLSQASGVAMREMGFKEKNMDDRYFRCLDHTSPAGFDCKSLSKTMRVVLAQEGIPVSVSNLTDKALFKQIYAELQLRTYYSL